MNSGGSGWAASSVPAKPFHTHLFVHLFLCGGGEWAMAAVRHPYQLSHLVHPYTEFLFLTIAVTVGPLWTRPFFLIPFIYFYFILFYIICTYICIHISICVSPATAVSRNPTLSSVLRHQACMWCTCRQNTHIHFFFFNF